jgi:hypothetical protein
MCYYGNGFNQYDLYRMPTYLRNFYYNRLVEAKKGEFSKHNINIGDKFDLKNKKLIVIK